MLAALLLSFAVIFVAELGDKTQLVAMMFALRYRWWVVLSAITVATTAVHVLSVAIGHHLGAALPTHLLGLIAGAMFIFFGLWTLRGDSLSDEEASVAEKATAPAFFVVTSAFVLAELGDKTMLATITLTTQHNWFGVWIGSTLGMVAADGLAIAVGALLGSRLPERAIAIGATILFFGFGAWLLAEAWPQLGGTSRIVTGLVVAVTMVGGGLVVRRAHRAAAAAPSDPDAAPAQITTPGEGRTAIH